MDKKTIEAIIDSKKAELSALSDEIWGYAELAFTEYKSADALCRELEKEGFAVTRNVADIETAFSASYGSGHPVIGILGEFDALSGLSQQAGCAVRTPIQPGGSGHGCGHNMLGVGSIAAAIGIKEYLAATGKSGTVIYYGTPGEEGGSGKAFMAREGVFDCLDAALTWHPSDLNAVMAGSSLANVQVAYKFKGVAAHAAAVPHLGRSALDAVELMNVGVQFLREHVIPEARIHYAITNSGGFSPNVVQPEAEVLYLIRAPKNAQVQEIYARVNKIASGAAMMTETDLEIDFYKACSNLVPNTTLERLIYKNLTQLELPEYSGAELDFARAIQESVENKSDTVAALIEKTADYDIQTMLRSHLGEAINDFVVPYVPNEVPMAGSTDVGDVSWVCPTAQVNTACYASGTPGHSWQLVAQGRENVAHTAMLQAGKVLAATAIDLIEDPDLLAKAKAEHSGRVGDGYVCPIPKGVKPRAMGKPGK
ncbi:MAG: amidohydrolase [Clostridiales bacterium]|nr:amidohydrolase [Clostridiales bacterium]